MKNWQLVSFAVMGLILILVAGLSLAQGAGPQQVQNGAPQVVSYQGQVTVDGSPYAGTGYFKFAFVNATGTTSFWSNDGTSTGGGQPTNGTPLPVSNGLFHVLLGDTSLTNMTEALGARVFDGKNRYLRVWFSSDNISFEQLSPDRRIAAVPYALQATNADTLDGQHANDLALPSGALILGRTDEETTLIDAGFSYSGRSLFNNWSTRADMPTVRFNFAAAAVDGVIYAIGGDTGFGATRAVEAYDPVANAWTTKAHMPTGRAFFEAVVVDGVIYAFGGSWVPGPEQSIEAYDPVANSWSTKAPMPTARSHFAAAVVDGVVYVIGGRSAASDREAMVEAYDPVANAWSTKAPMPTGRSSPGAALVDDVVYVVGGSSTSNDFETVVEAYDPLANTWDTRAAMPTGRVNPAAAAVDGVIYAIGGRDGTGVLGANEAFDPSSNTWSSQAALPTPRSSLAAVAVDGAIYAIGGSALVGVNQQYTPALFIYSKD